VSSTERRSPASASRAREAWRCCNQRFIEIDKQLLHTCEELRHVGDTLNSVLKVIDER